MATLDDPAAGSSPRMRGTLNTWRWNNPLSGIIPAYAGNTIALQCLQARRRDHPRVCGEHRLPERPADLEQGSSPRMRGTHADLSEDGELTGIIPAYAGNTQLTSGVSTIT